MVLTTRHFYCYETAIRKQSFYKRKNDLNTKKWKKVLNDNCDDMYSGNCWGVPSFKITNSDGSDPYYVWGQDRMWLLKEEIHRRLS